MLKVQLWNGTEFYASMECISDFEKYFLRGPDFKLDPSGARTFTPGIILVRLGCSKLSRVVGCSYLVEWKRTLRGCNLLRDNQTEGASQQSLLATELQKASPLKLEVAAKLPSHCWHDACISRRVASSHKHRADEIGALKKLSHVPAPPNEDP